MSRELTAADFTTDQEVRWCPGCGDYAILKAMRSALAEIGTAPHETVFVSGIGCAARFPYYINSFGFHTVHGRAPAVASGIAMANPDADIWVVGGDGDLLSIGGNHLMHTLRRDIDMNILLFNNAIYGLTKGQFSPTSPVGTKSPSSPGGSADAPVNAALLALGGGARFVARSADTMLDHLAETFKRAHGRDGTTFVEILQNCLIYNDGVWGGLASKKTRADRAVMVRHGAPLVFGAADDKGLVWDPAAGTFEIVTGEADAVARQATVFDETSFAQAVSLARMEGDGFPVALGVLYHDPGATRPAAGGATGARPLDAGRLQEIVNGRDTWVVPAR